MYPAKNRLKICSIIKFSKSITWINFSAVNNNLSHLRYSNAPLPYIWTIWRSIFVSFKINSIRVQHFNNWSTITTIHSSSKNRLVHNQALGEMSVNMHTSYKMLNS